MLTGRPTLGRTATVVPARLARPAPPGVRVPSWWREDAGRSNLLAARDAIRAQEGR